jgi:hypothetical protein
MALPFRNGADGYGRAANGTFAPGNKGGPGAGSYAHQVAAFRAALIGSVTTEDLVSVTHVLIEKARGGNLFAIRELYDRLLGKPDQAHKIVAAIGTNALTPDQVAEMLLAGRAELPPA